MKTILSEDDIPPNLRPFIEVLLSEAYEHSPESKAPVSTQDVIAIISTVYAAPQTSKPDAATSSQAFLQVYKVFTSPRCQNCHPAGDAPLQGDDSHIHMQNVNRGKDGHGTADKGKHRVRTNGAFCK